MFLCVSTIKMRKVQKIHIISFILAFALVSCASQKKILRKAEASFENGEYFAALSFYERLLESEDSRSGKAELYYSVAECYRHLNNSRRAETFYRRAQSSRSREKMLQYWYGQALLQNGKISDAIAAFELFKQQNPRDPRADNALESCSLAVAWKDNPTRYKVELIKAFGSREHDFAPAYASGDFTTIFFTSSRPRDEKSVDVNPVSGMNYTDLYEIRNDRRGRWTEPLLVTDTIFQSNFDDGTPAFNAAKTEIFFTRCLQEDGKNLGCQIYSARLKAGGWSDLTKLKIVPDSVSVGHPSISADGLTLYFAARMKEGFGGADIWKVERTSESAEWGNPINLGDVINTPGDELFPFIREDGTLFFSSDYHPGMGGLDIFRAVKDNLGVWKIYNMQSPVNSNQDDYAITFQGSREAGLFSSNRRGGRGIDNIYSFELPELEIYVEGKILDASTKRPIAEAEITLIGSDGTLQNTKSKLDGSYTFRLSQYTDYIVVGSYQGYLKNKVQITTNNISDNKTFEENVELLTMSKPIEIPNILYESGQWTLNDESKRALELLTKLLEDNPNITIELGAHTDMIGDDAANMLLSKRRAQAIVAYLEERSYDPERFVAKGYGESIPVVVTDEIARLDTAFVVGQSLTSEFIKNLPKETQEIANQINRRTEIKILSTDYIPRPEFFLKLKQKFSSR